MLPITIKLISSLNNLLYSCMHNTFARARTKPRPLGQACACIQDTLSSRARLAYNIDVHLGMKRRKVILIEDVYTCPTSRSSLRCAAHFVRGRTHSVGQVSTAQIVVRFTLSEVPLPSPSGYCLDMEVVNYWSQLFQEVLRDLNRCSFCHAGSFGRRRMGGARKRIGVRRRREVVRRGYGCMQDTFARARARPKG